MFLFLDWVLFCLILIVKIFEHLIPNHVDFILHLLIVLLVHQGFRYLSLAFGDFRLPDLGEFPI